MNYYISDLHLFHKNVTGEGSNFDNRPFATLDEMHRTIKENWNNTVTNAIMFIFWVIWRGKKMRKQYHL